MNWMKSISESTIYAKLGIIYTESSFTLYGFNFKNK